jgi:hypothetical protein
MAMQRPYSGCATLPYKAHESRTFGGLHADDLLHGTLRQRRGINTVQPSMHIGTPSEHESVNKVCMQRARSIAHGVHTVCIQR